MLTLYCLRHCWHWPKSPSLCATVRAVPWADKPEQQLCRIAPSRWDLCIDIRTLGAQICQSTSSFHTLHRGLENKASKQPCLCTPVHATPWTEQAEQQIFRLASSGWELTGDSGTFRAGISQSTSRFHGVHIALENKEAYITTLSAPVPALP